MKLYFVSQNTYKQDEARAWFAGSGLMDVSLEIVPWGVQELMSFSLEEIARHKVLQAFQSLSGLPCVIEHGGLFVDALKGLPSGLSRVVWDQVGDQLCTWIPPSGSRSAVARSVVAYCDGRKVHLFQGETPGEIAPNARGTYAFQWDPIFIPQGERQTYAEMGLPAKTAHSQGHKAWKLLYAHLKAHPRP